MGRAPCCDKANVKKGPWSPEEDAKLKTYIHQHGTGGNWIALPQKIGLKRCGKSCRLRWLNYLRPNLKHGAFSEEEDHIICTLYITIGSRWSIIAAQLPGRTDNDIKNYWNTRLKKKLLGKQRKEKHGRGRSRKQFSGETSDALATSALAAQPPLQLSSIPYFVEDPGLNDHASIRKLLIKLGGRFSTDQELYQIDEQIKLQYPAIDEALTQPVLYNNDPVQIPNLVNGPTISVPHFDMVGNIHELLPLPSADLNPQKLQGLEFFYDDFINGGDSLEMSSLMFAASASNSNQGFLQGSTMEEFAVDKMKYPGTQ